MAKNVLALLATMESASAIDDAIHRKMLGIRVVIARKEILLVISNEDTDYIIKIIKSLENSIVLIDGVNQTVKYKIKKQENGFPGTLENMLIRKGVMRAGKEYIMDKIF